MSTSKTWRQWLSRFTNYRRTFSHQFLSDEILFQKVIEIFPLNSFYVLLFCFLETFATRHCGSREEGPLCKVFSLKSGVGQNIARYALLAVRNSASVLPLLVSFNFIYFFSFSFLIFDQRVESVPTV